MDISPSTDREKLIAEVAYLQGLQEGLALGVSQAMSVNKAVFDGLRRTRLVDIQKLDAAERQMSESSQAG